MLIHVLNILFIDIPLHISYLFVLSCFISFHISYTFRVILYFTSCSCNRILSSHSSAMLLISCHILCTPHLRVLVIFFYVSYMFHACKYLRSGYGKELSIPEGTIIVRDSDLYLYDSNGVAIMIQTKSMSSTQMRP